MARGKYVSDFERDVIRVGVAHGVSQTLIARLLKRTDASVCQQIKRMRGDGTLGKLPLPFVADELAGEMVGADDEG